MLFSSCIVEDANLQFEEINREPVFYSFLHPDSVITATFFYTKRPLDTSAMYITGATINVYEDGEIIETLQHAGKGHYRSTSQVSPQVGHMYFMRILSDELATVLQTPPEVIPEAPQLASITVEEDGTFETNTGSAPKVILQIDEPLDPDGLYLWSLENLFEHITRIDAGDLFVTESHDCYPNLWSFTYSEFLGKRWDCLKDDTIELGWFFSNAYPRDAEYRFTWGTMNPSAAEFFESRGIESGFDVAELFFQPSTVNSNIPGAHGVFTAYNTTDYILTF